MRLEMKASLGTAAGWIETMEKADGWVQTDSSHPDESRWTHRKGSVCRIFTHTGRDDTPHDSSFTYPPGGTDHPTGPLVRPPFAPKNAKGGRRRTASKTADASNSSARSSDPADGSPGS